ncbi:MAG: 30S ribosomal protein S12 methylthiotransferase RimO [Candidatus Hydrogenedentes bacterium]|nr:30S ribosomal protein S12 methylthiotransferase RimO [Candidatus Hydrogenedentota bacterium]
MTGSGNKARIGIVVLGCDKNTADAEHFAGRLEERLSKRVTVLAAGTPDDSPPDLDAVIIFTCAFIHDAKTESVEMILAWTTFRTEWGVPGRVYVAGCLSERYRKELEAEIPEVDAFVGIHELDALLARIGGMVSEEAVACDEFTPRKRLTDMPYGFLKIADGCDRKCTFCVIPDIKGPFASLPKETLLADAAALVASGVREINLVAQDTTAYGKDLYAHYGLAELLGDLCALPGDFWIRCLYCYPNGITDALIAQMVAQSKIAPYLDIPLQHVSPPVLKAMGRPEKARDVAALLGRLRREIPGMVLRTTMLVGFPGETEEDHQAMLKFIEEQHFEWLGAFTYSAEEGSPAARMKGHVPGPVARRRREAVMALQAEITEAFNQRREGHEDRVLIEEFDREMGLWKGRSRAEAPEVDGAVYVEADPSLASGIFVRVRMTRADGYDIHARVTP